MSKPKQIEVVDAGFQNPASSLSGWAGSTGGWGTRRIRISSLSTADEAQATFYDSMDFTLIASRQAGIGVVMDGTVGTNDQSEESEGVLVEYAVDASIMQRVSSGVYPHYTTWQVILMRGQTEVSGGEFHVVGADWMLAPGQRWSSYVTAPGSATSEMVQHSVTCRGVVNLRDTNLGAYPDEYPLALGVSVVNQDISNSIHVGPVDASLYLRRWYEDLRNVQPGN